MLVWCLIIDHNRTILGRRFKVSCPPGADVDDLTNLVVAAKPDLQGVDPTYVLAYHSPTVHRGLKTGQLRTAISELDLDNALVEADEVVSELLPEDGLLVLKKPAPRKQASFKRPLSPSTLNHYESLNKTKLARIAPSDMAKASQYTSIQKNPKERIFDDRPYPDTHIAPIALLYPPFGEFEDIFANGLPPNDTRAVNLRNVEENVNALAGEMSLFYETEFERRGAALPLLNAILEFKIQAGEIGHVRSDGHCEVDGIISTNVEFKNAPAGTASFPHAPCVGYVVRCHVRGDKAEDLCNRWRLPSLAITFIDDLVQFYAIILLGHQSLAVPLTPALSFSLLATSAMERKQLFSAFIAAKVLQQRIHRDLESYIDTKLHQGHLLRSPGHLFLPSVTKILKYGADDKNADFMEFTILGQFSSTGEKTFRDRRLYEAQLIRPATENDSNNINIVVKFSRHYSIDLHNFCHEQGHAPRILGFELLPGGWFAIAMEHLANAKPIDSGLSANQRNELEHFVTGLHSQGLVHGDLRDSNILYNSDNFWLIDFDWGGKAGEAQYPTWYLHEELLSGRQFKDLIIRAEDDLRILHATLKNLKDLE